MSMRRRAIAASSIVIAIAGAVGLWRTQARGLPHPRAWSALQAREYLFGQQHHWCNGGHGHVPGRGPIGACLGRYGLIAAGLAARLNEPGFMALLVDVITDHPNEEFVQRIAEHFGRQRAEFAAPALAARMRQRGTSNELELTRASLAWALEALAARDHVGALLEDLHQAEFYRVHAIGALASDDVRDDVRRTLIIGGARSDLVEQLDCTSPRHPHRPPHGR